MGTLGFIDPVNGGMAPIVEQTRVAIRMCYKLVVSSSIEGFGPPFSTEEACSKM